MCEVQRRRLLTPSVTLLPFSGKPVRREPALYHSAERACEPQKGAGCRVSRGEWGRRGHGLARTPGLQVRPIVRRCRYRRDRGDVANTRDRTRTASAPSLRIAAPARRNRLRHSHLGAARVVPRSLVLRKRARRRSPRVSPRRSTRETPEDRPSNTPDSRGNEETDSRLKCKIPQGRSTRACSDTLPV